MNQHPEIARGSFLGEWTEEMTEQLTAGLNDAEPEEMDDHYHRSELNDENDDAMDVEDDGIIDDGTDPAVYFQRFLAHYNNQSSNNNNNQQDKYDPSFDPHLNW